MTGERTHARYSASFAPTLFRCKGAANLLRRVPPAPSSPYAVEGTKAHNVVEAALANHVWDAKTAHVEHSDWCFEELDTRENLFYFSVQVMLDYVAKLLTTYPDAVMYTERRVVPPTVNAPGEAAGYCDVAIHIPSIRSLIIIDYKHGAGVVVEADSEQLKQYAAGFLYEDNAVLDVALIDYVTLAVVQPRAFHPKGAVREHETTPFEIWEYLQELDACIAEAERPDAPLTPGEKQCRFCDAAAVCPAREAEALAVVDKTYSQIKDVTRTFLPDPHAMDVERLATIRAHAGTLRKWLDVVDDRCYELARSGHYIPGAKLVEASPKRRYYGTETEVARRIGSLIGDPTLAVALDHLAALQAQFPSFDKFFDVKLLPLTTAEKHVVEHYKRLSPRGKMKQAAEDARKAFAYLTLKDTSGTLSLVDESDPRPAVNATRNAFDQIMTQVNPALPAP